MKAICPACRSQIPPEQINVAANVAACAHCGEVFALSSLTETQPAAPEFDLAEPPSGAWYRQEMRGWRIGATTRSPIAFFLVPFMCVWSGFSLGGLYGMQIVNGKFDLFMSLFGLPFLIGSLLFGGLAAMTVCGRIEVSTSDNEGRVFAGIGPFGWTRRFDWDQITEIKEEVPGYHYTGIRGQVISLVGNTRIKFGSMLSDQRRYYLLQGLRALQQQG